MQEIAVTEHNQTLFTSLQEYLSIGNITSGLYLVFVIWLYVEKYLDSFYLFLTFLLVGGTSLYMDTVRMRADRSNFTKRLFWYRTTRYLPIFLAAGYLHGLFSIYVSNILPFLIDSLTLYLINVDEGTVQNFSIGFISNSAITLSIIYIGTIIGLSFYRILVESSEIGDRKQLFSGGHDIGFLLQFFILSSTLPSILLSFAFGQLHFSLLASFSGSSIISSFVASSFGLINYLLFFLFLLMLAIMVSVYLSRYILNRSQYRFPRASSHIMLGLAFFTLFGIAYFLMLFFRSSIFQPFSVFITALIFEGVTIFQLRNGMNGEVCSECHLLKVVDKNELYCASCESDAKMISIPALLRRKTKSATCPNCNALWKHFSRKCDSCDFLYILSCPHCDQTINPLWNVCINCTSELIPIPQLALSTGSYQSFSKIATSTLIFGSILLLNLLFELLTILTISNLDAETMAAYAWYFQSSIVRMSVFVIGIFSLMSLVIKFSSTYLKPVLFLSGKLIFSLLNIIFLYSVLYLPINYLVYVYPSLPILISPFLLLLLIGLLGYVWVSQWRGLMEFRPTLDYDPFFDNISEVSD